MADSYYDNPPHSATTGGSVSPNGAYGHDGRTSSMTPNGRGATPSNSYPNGGGAASTPNPIVRKKLASWVGFSNLPNQVHRRSVR